MEKATKTPHCSEALLKSILGSLNEQSEFRRCAGASMHAVGLCLIEAGEGEIELDPMFPIGGKVVEGDLKEAKRCIEHIERHCGNFSAFFAVRHDSNGTTILPHPGKIMPVGMQFVCDTAIAV